MPSTYRRSSNLGVRTVRPFCQCQRRWCGSDTMARGVQTRSCSSLARRLIAVFHSLRPDLSHSGQGFERTRWTIVKAGEVWQALRHVVLASDTPFLQQDSHVGESVSGARYKPLTPRQASVHLKRLSSSSRFPETRGIHPKSCAVNLPSLPCKHNERSPSEDLDLEVVGPHASLQLSLP